MLIKSTLFSKGAWSRQPGLTEVLESHRQTILKKVRAVSDLGEMTDSFLERLVKEALVEPLDLHFDRIRRKTRTEEAEGRAFPGDPFGHRSPRSQQQVARISVPFSGDPTLFQYTPNAGVMNFPQGEVCGDVIQFDVVMADDARVREQL